MLYFKAFIITISIVLGIAAFFAVLNFLASFFGPGSILLLAFFGAIYMTVVFTLKDMR